MTTTFSSGENVKKYGASCDEENYYENVPPKLLETAEKGGVGKRSQNGPRASLQHRRNRSKRQPLKEEDAQTLTPKSSLRRVV